jgi:hypothetical protein
MDYSKELKIVYLCLYNHACILESFDILKEFYAEFK